MIFARALSRPLFVHRSFTQGARQVLPCIDEAVLQMRHHTKVRRTSDQASAPHHASHSLRTSLPTYTSSLSPPSSPQAPPHHHLITTSLLFKPVQSLLRLSLSLPLPLHLLPVLPPPSPPQYTILPHNSQTTVTPLPLFSRAAPVGLTTNKRFWEREGTRLYGRGGRGKGNEGLLRERGEAREV